MKGAICYVAGLIGTTIAYMFGGWDSSIITLLIFMVIDYISGLLVAGVFHASKKTESGKLQSNYCWQGLIKKGMTLLFVVIGVRLDLAIGTTYIRDGVCIAFMVNELISIIENAGLMGIPIPNVITNAIEVLNKGSEEVHEN